MYVLRLEFYKLFLFQVLIVNEKTSNLRTQFNNALNSYYVLHDEMY